MIPYKKFIITLLFFAKDVKYILEKISSFNYYVESQWIIDVFQEIKTILPPNIVELLDAKQVLDDKHIDWLKQLDIYELYDYILKKEKSEYYKWGNDCMWVINNNDVMILMNILLFNNEPFDSISDIIQFRFKKKLGIEMIAIYKKMFWECDNMNAKDAFLYCIPFRDSSLIIREFMDGNTEIEINSASHNGCNSSVVFHDINYIKWKIGYKKIKAINTKDFLDQVKTDSMYKYYEIMSMNRHATVEEEEISSDQFGTTNTTRSKYENVEESKARLAKKWIELYLKAEEKSPTGINENDEFFDKMNQVSLQFDDCKETITTIDNKLLQDIKGDM